MPPHATIPEIKLFQIFHALRVIYATRVIGAIPCFRRVSTVFMTAGLAMSQVYQRTTFEFTNFTHFISQPNKNANFFCSTIKTYQTCLKISSSVLHWENIFTTFEWRCFTSPRFHLSEISRSVKFISNCRETLARISITFPLCRLAWKPSLLLKAKEFSCVTIAAQVVFFEAKNCQLIICQTAQTVTIFLGVANRMESRRGHCTLNWKHFALGRLANKVIGPIFSLVLFVHKTLCNHFLCKHISASPHKFYFGCFPLTWFLISGEELFGRPLQWGRIFAPAGLTYFLHVPETPCFTNHSWKLPNFWHQRQFQCQTQKGPWREGRHLEQRGMHPATILTYFAATAMLPFAGWEGIELFEFHDEILESASAFPFCSASSKKKKKHPRVGKTNSAQGFLRSPWQLRQTWKAFVNFITTARKRCGVTGHIHKLSEVNSNGTLKQTHRTC